MAKLESLQVKRFKVKDFYVAPEVKA